MKRILTTAFVVTIMLFSVVQANASSILTEQSLKNFLATMTGVKQMADQMSDGGRDKLINKGMQEMQNGEFTPYVSAVNTIRDTYPSDYKQLDTIISEYGFSSPEAWALTGDAVMAAYMNVSVGDQIRQGVAAMSNMDPQTMGMMPPQAKQHMERSKAMVKALDSVPAGNNALIKTHMDDIERAMNSMQK